MNYIVGDFIIQIKNAVLARKREIVTPYSNINKAIAKVLIKESFIASVTEETVDGKKVLRVTIRYQRRKPALTNVEIVSKPSLRVYIGADEVGKKQGNSAIAILSTNQGVITGKEAIKKKLGGEFLFKVW